MMTVMDNYGNGKGNVHSTSSGRPERKSRDEARIGQQIRNPNSEFRNKFKILIFKCSKLFLFRSLEFRSFDIASNFDIRISDFKLTGIVTVTQKRCPKRGQATTEIAIFGTIMLVVFATLLRYGMIYNAKQATQMYAFRQALNLTQQRYYGTLAGRRQFANVNLNVMKNLFPVSTVTGSVQEVSVADGSASIFAENEPSYFGNPQVGVQNLDDVGGTYYQIGDKMYVNNSYIMPAYIRELRKINKGKAPTSPWDGIMDFLDGSDDKKDYWTLEPMPYREQEQYTNVTHNSQYATSENLNNAAYGEIGVTQTTTQTIYKPPAYTLPQLTQELIKWDPDVKTVSEVLGYNAPVDMNVTIEQEITKQRIWNSQKQ